MTLTRKTRTRSVILLSGWLAVCVALGAAAGLAVSAASAQSGTGCVGCGGGDENYLCKDVCGSCPNQECSCNIQSVCKIK